MKYLEIFLLCALSSLGGYTICVWQPKPHVVQFMDQGKPGKAARKPLDLSKWSTCEAADKEDWNGYACVDGKPVRVEGVSGMDTPLQIIDARNPLIVALGEAIAREEGFFAWTGPREVTRGTLAQRLNNPGMLVYAGQPGGDSGPLAENCNSGICSPSYANFLTDDAGWAALYADLRAKWSSVSVVKECSQYDLFDGGQGYNNLMRCKVHAIAYYWSTGDREKYARDVVADLKARGILK